MSTQLTERLQALLGSAYRLDRELSGGGMSRVFVANEPALKRHVVVKVLPPDLVTSSSVERFEREIEVTAQLQHPHILPVITAGGEGDLYYYITPYISGESLKDRLTKDEKLPFDEALRLIGELLGAVAFAHARGVVHRDIKPGNVLLSEGHAILADFGISRALAGPDDGQVTMSGTLIGTPAYMAPENPRDEKADLYAVAVVAIEMLTGKRPKVKGDAKRVSEEFAAIAEKGVARRAKAVGEVLARATSMDAERRYQSARELRDAVAAAGAQRATGRALALVAAAVIVVGALLAPKVYREFKPLPSGYVDRVAVLPVRAASPSGQASTETEPITAAIRAALARWSGVREAGSDIGEPAAGESLGDFARRVSRAGEPTTVLSVQVAAEKGNPTLEAYVYAPSGRLLRRLDVAVGDAGVTAAAAIVANAALRSGELLPPAGRGGAGALSLVAWRMLDSAEQLTQAGRYTEADSVLATAVERDSSLTIARFRRAELLSWLSEFGREAEISQQWKEVGLRSASLFGQDSARAKAWLSLRSGNSVLACAQFDSLTRSTSSVQAAWLGLGDCRRTDLAIVVRDGRATYRSGWHGAALAYERALETWPASAPAFLYRRLASVLPYQSHRTRMGIVVGSRDVLGAMPSMMGPGDTVTYVPRAAKQVVSSDTRFAEAIERNASRLRTAVQRWIVERPLDAEARRLHAELLEAGHILEGPSEGQRSALSEAREAARLARTASDRARADAIAVRILIKARRWADARSVIDSALARFSESDPELANRLSPLAALRGDAEMLRRAIRIAGAMPERAIRTPDRQILKIPPTLMQMQADVVARAILGQCGDEVRFGLEDLKRQITALEPNPNTQSIVRAALIDPALELAVPCLGYSALSEISGPLAIHEAERRASRREFRAAADTVRAEERARAVKDRGVRSADFTLRETWIELAAGDTAAAIARLDDALAGLARASPMMVEWDVDAASFLRILRLAAELHSARDGEKSYFARTWRAAADTLSLPSRRR